MGGISDDPEVSRRVSRSGMADSIVLGFDHDRPDVFEKTVAWIEEARLECATFHVLTPYPGMLLFRQMETEGRLLHKDWSLYDTSHVVFRPRHMTAEELSEGYARCYERVFSNGSIWRRRPEDWRAVPPYLAMSYLYKRSNRMWDFLIRHRLTGPVWRPLVGWTRRRHLRSGSGWSADHPRRTRDGGAVVSPGV